MNNLQKNMRRAAWVVLFGMSGNVFAHAGEDHSQDDKKAATGASTAATVLPGATGDDARPRRQADGSVYLPKPVQRQMSLRTVVAGGGRYPKSVELAGTVVGDPAASGRVQATQGGRIEAPAGGLASLGQRVRAGEVLAVLRPVASALERSAQQAQLAELSAQLAVAEKKRDRARQLEGLAPQKEIEASQIDVEGIRARLAAVRAGVDGSIPLTAPVSGVIAASSVVAGQVVEARELLFEIVDPARLAVEALAYEAALVDQVVGGSIAVGEGRTARLRYIGGARQLREGALPLLFRIEAPKGERLLALAVGQSVSVLAQTRSVLKGVVLPNAALVRDGQGEAVVWVKLAPEHFAPRKVLADPLDAAQVVVTDGIKAGERVVSIGASLLSQVR